jgi:hypothetical protein
MMFAIRLRDDPIPRRDSRDLAMDRHDGRIRILRKPLLAVSATADYRVGWPIHRDTRNVDSREPLLGVDDDWFIPESHGRSPLKTRDISVAALQRSVFSVRCSESN